MRGRASCCHRRADGVHNAAAGRRDGSELGDARPVMHKLVHVFFNMERMVGKDFESGLANLKKLAEA